MTNNFNPLIERTDAKLRYAKIHLEELVNHLKVAHGDDFGRSHEESFLFHLFGARDAFLQELNSYYGFNFPEKDVQIRSLKKEADKLGGIYPEVNYIEQLERDSSSWLSKAKEWRNHSTHRNNLVHHYYLGGENHGKIHTTDPKSKQRNDIHISDLYSEWLMEMDNMIKQLRADILNRII